MLVIHVINGTIYAVKYSVMTGGMQPVNLDEAIRLLTSEVTRK
jgi:hypothetical protein